MSISETQKKACSFLEGNIANSKHEHWICRSKHARFYSFLVTAKRAFFFLLWNWKNLRRLTSHQWNVQQTTHTEYTSSMNRAEDFFLLVFRGFVRTGSKTSIKFTSTMGHFRWKFDIFNKIWMETMELFIESPSDEANCRSKLFRDIFTPSTSFPWRTGKNHWLYL